MAYDYDHRTAGTGYGTHFQTIVDCVDDLEAAAKKVSKAMAALKALQKKIDSDPDVAELPGMDKYAPEQRLQDLKEALESADTAIRNLASEYEGANKAFLRMGLK